MKQYDYDVIIIGCGLVGGSLALTLPEKLSVAVIDAESPMQKQPGYLALNVHSCRILEHFGVWKSIISQEKAATAIRQIDISELNQPIKQLILRAEDIGFPALGYVTSTIAIRETLLNHIQSRKNITLLCPERAENIIWPDDGMEKISVMLAQQKKVITARLVIMADGGRSPLREQLGFDIHEKKTAQHIVITKLQADKPHQGEAFERFTEEGPIALLPVEQCEYVLVWTMHESQMPEFLAQTHEALIQKLEKAYDLESIKHWKETGTRRSFPIARSYAKNPIKTRLVLMGNAAHTVHPVGAQGYNLSLKDAAELSFLIEEALEKGLDIGSERLLKKYLEGRQEDTEFVLYFTQFLLDVFSQPFLAKARSLGMRWINELSPVKQAILKRTTGRSGAVGKIPPSPPLQRGETFSGGLKRGETKIAPFQKGGSEAGDFSNKGHSSDVDIIILGNRLIGSTLACALDSRYRIAILDKASTPALPQSDDYEPRINAYNRASEALLRSIHVWDKLPKERHFMFDKIFATDGTKNNSLFFEAKNIHESHIGHFIENDLVTYYLHQEIKSRSNIHWVDDASVMNIQIDDDKVSVITDDHRIFSGKLLAACDGGNSITRSLLGIDVSRHPYYQRCIVGNIFFEGDLENTAWQRFLKTGPIGLLPLRKGVCSLAWSCDNTEAERLLELSDEIFIHELHQAVLGRLGKITHVSKRFSFPLVAQEAETYVAPRTLLLGDAAHTIHPLAGLGANLGFQDVMAAAELLNDPKISSRDIGRRYLLEKYEKMRRRQNALIMHTMTAFNALFHENYPLLNPIGRFSLNLANKITPIKNALFRQAMWMGKKDNIKAFSEGL